MKLPLIAIASLVIACDGPVNHVAPEDAAKQWLSDTSTPYEGSPSCTGGDTDHDGYVTCLVRRPKSDIAQGEFLSLQCAARGAGEFPSQSPYTSGCKLTSMMKQ